MAWPLPTGARGAADDPPPASARQLPPGLSVQVFGLRDSRPTQKALRFFRERRIQPSFVDLSRRPLAAGELRRFTERFGARALVDDHSRAYRDAGLAWLTLDEESWTARLLADHRLLRLPLVRSGNLLAVGDAEATWRSWLASP